MVELLRLRHSDARRPCAGGVVGGAATGRTFLFFFLVTRVQESGKMKSDKVIGLIVDTCLWHRAFPWTDRGGRRPPVNYPSNDLHLILGVQSLPCRIIKRHGVIQNCGHFLLRISAIKSLTDHIRR